jgi:hypothetical protein
MEKLNMNKQPTIRGDRWFVETKDGFDGTANGYGFKTPQAVYKSYAYFKSKDQRAQQDKDVKNFLKENSDVKEVLDAYLSEDECFYRMKDQEPTSVANLLDYLEDESVAEKIKTLEPLWKAILKYYGF